MFSLTNVDLIKWYGSGTGDIFTRARQTPKVAASQMLQFEIMAKR